MRLESNSWWQQALADLAAAEANLGVKQCYVCYTPEEFEHKRRQLGIVQRAVCEGIEVELD